MLELLQRLFVGHAHRWREDKRVSLQVEKLTHGGMGERVYCTCTICGKPKKWDLA